MQRKKLNRWVMLMSTLLLIVMALAISRSSPAHAQEDKIEPGLRETIENGPNGQGEFLVYMSEQADLGDAFGFEDRDERGEYVYNTLFNKAQSTQTDLLAYLNQQQSFDDVTEYRSFYIVNAVAVTGNVETLDALAARPDVSYIEGVKEYSIPEPIPGDEMGINALEWGVAKIRADEVWADFGTKGEGIVVANIDTGVLHTHATLVNQYRGTTTGSHDYNWYDPSGTYPTQPGDNNGHGTHTMGTIAGDDGGNNQIGVAPGAKWIAAKGCESSSCSNTSLLASAEWVLAPYPIGGTPAQGDSSKRPHLVNNSWGGGGGNTWYEASVQAWRAAEILPVFSAGNSGSSPGSIGSPSDYAESFAVGATDSNDNIASFSSRGPSSLTDETKPDVSAPGVSVRSAWNNGGYNSINGTSMAAPHVAGCAALLKSLDPSLTIDQIENKLRASAVDLGTAGPDYDYGYGRIDCRAAADDAPPGDPDIEVDPESFSVTLAQGQSMTKTLTIDNVGNGTLTFDIVDEETSSPSLYGEIIGQEAQANEADETGLVPGLVREYVPPVNATALADVTVLAYGVQSSEITRLQGIGATVDVLASPSTLPSIIANYDVFYVGHSNSAALASYASQINTYVQAGGGLIIEQPNQVGSVGMMPTGFEIVVSDVFWPNPYDNLTFTSEAVSHPITQDLTPADLSGNYDTIYDSDLGSDFTILSRHATETNSVALAAGPHGSGRIVLHTGNLSFSAGDPGTDQYIDAMFSWAANGHNNPDALWLSEDPLSGSVAGGGSQSVDVTFDATGLDLGTYTADIIISNNDPDENPVIVEAELIVSNDVPDIEVNPDYFDVTLAAGDQTTETLTISNVGGGTLTFDITDEQTGAPFAVQEQAPVGLSTTDVNAYEVVPTEQQILAGNSVLIIQDQLPWGLDSIQQVLTTHGIAYDLVSSSQMATVDLASYEMVVIPSVQTDNYYNTWNANLSRFENYVDAGGLLWLSACNQSSQPEPLIPGGIIGATDLEPNNNVIEPTHPWVAGVPNLITHNYASHDSFTNLYANSTVIAEAEGSNNATLVDYTYGSGRVFLTGQTLEHIWHYDGNGAPILENSLLDMLNQAGNSDALWLSENPLSGSVAGGGSKNVDVTFDATGLSEGVYTADIIISNNDPDENPTTVPVTLTVGMVDDGEFTRTLESGWNLVSFPVEVDDTDIEDVLASIDGQYEIVYAYDQCGAGWKKFDPNGPPFANTLTDLDHSIGFWIYMTEAAKLVVTGSTPDSTTMPVCSGWNLVGYPTPDTRDLPDALDSISGKYILVNAFKPPWQKFDPNGPPFANTLTDMQAGFGYWINATQDGEVIIE